MRLNLIGNITNKLKKNECDYTEKSMSLTRQKYVYIYILFQFKGILLFLALPGNSYELRQDERTERTLFVRTLQHIP